MAFFDSIGKGINIGMGFIFGWAISISPYFAILLVTIFLTLISTLVYKYTSDQIRLKSIKEEMDNLKKRMKEAKGDMEKVSALNKQMTTLSLETMKHSIFNFKYMVITLIPLGLAFSWLRTTFSPMNLWGSAWGWFWIYMIFSLVISQVIRKLLKVY